MKTFVLLALLLTGSMLLVGGEATPPASNTPTSTVKLTLPELEKLVARIALFPDALIAQILPASTYPIEIVQAARFAKEKETIRKFSVTEFQKEVDKQKWENSVKVVALSADALKMMNDDLDWTSQLGEAFLAQQEDVMQAIQNMRGRARANGYLKDSKEQIVLADSEAIRILPTDPEIIYVPQYNPQVVYVDQPATTVVTQPSTTTVIVDDDDDEWVAAASGIIGFGAGIAMGAWLSNDCHWGYHGGVHCHGYGHYGHAHYGHVSHYNSNYNSNYNRNNNFNNNNNFNSNRNRVDHHSNSRQMSERFGNYNGERVNGARNPNAKPTPYSDRNGDWKHSGEHRRGQSYQNKGAYDRARGGDSSSRARLRDSSTNGRTQSRDIQNRLSNTRPSNSAGQRPSASPRPSTSQRPSASQRPSGGQNRPSNTANRRSSSGSSAFGGSDRGSSARQHSNRGNESLGRSRPSSTTRSSPSRSSSSRSYGGGGSRGGGSRGGGGRGGGGRR